MCLTLRVVINVAILLGCQTLYVMFHISRAAHQLLGRLHTLLSFVQVENIDLMKLNGLELHLKMDQSYSPIY